MALKLLFLFWLLCQYQLQGNFEEETPIFLPSFLRSIEPPKRREWPGWRPKSPPHTSEWCHWCLSNSGGTNECVDSHHLICIQDSRPVQVHIVLNYTKHTQTYNHIHIEEHYNLIRFGQSWGLLSQNFSWVSAMKAMERRRIQPCRRDARLQAHGDPSRIGSLGETHEAYLAALAQAGWKVIGRTSAFKAKELKRNSDFQSLFQNVLIL